MKAGNRRHLLLLVGAVMAGLYVLGWPDRFAPGSREGRYGMKSRFDNSPTFRLLLARGSWLGGFAILLCEDGGRCEYIFEDPDNPVSVEGGVSKINWKHARFQLQRQDLDDIRHHLLNNGFFDLAADYARPEVHDGLSKVVWVEADGVKKVVTCRNSFPPAVEGLFSFLRVTILDRHREAISAAPPVDPLDFAAAQQILWGVN